MMQIKQKYGMVFEYGEVKKMLENLGFKKIGDNLYINEVNNIISFYAHRNTTPEHKPALLFIHKNDKSYAYDMQEIKPAYDKLVEMLNQ